MPTSLRNSRRCFGSRSSLWPATSIRPASKASSPLMQRKRVLLPEPLRPMMATTSPVSTDSETPFSTSSGPNRLCTSSMTTAGMKRPFEMAAEAGEREADREIQRRHRGEDLEGLEGGVVDQLPGPGEIDEADHRDDRGVLHQLHQEADARRQRDAQRLRQDDVAVLLRGAERQRRGGFPLLEGHGLDRAA